MLYVNPNKHKILIPFLASWNYLENQAGALMLFLNSHLVDARMPQLESDFWMVGGKNIKIFSP